MVTKRGLGPLKRPAEICMDGLCYMLKPGEKAELTITEAKPKEIDIERLRVDREYWDSVAPKWATVYIIDCDCGSGGPMPAKFHRALGDRWVDEDGKYWMKDRTRNSTALDVIPRPPEDREANKVDELPRMAIMVNPHETPLHYGEDHLGEAVEAIEYLADESCYVVRFKWGLGVLHESNVDFGLFSKRSKEERELEGLSGVICEVLHNLGWEPDLGDGRKIAAEIISSGYRKQ